eukprot:COSAG05_NODE_250_length_12887_cov_28.030810_4_plen_733_part_00
MGGRGPRGALPVFFVRSVLRLGRGGYSCRAAQAACRHYWQAASPQAVSPERDQQVLCCLFCCGDPARAVGAVRGGLARSATGRRWTERAGKAWASPGSGKMAVATDLVAENAALRQQLQQEKLQAENAALRSELEASRRQSRMWLLVVASMVAGCAITVSVLGVPHTAATHAAPHLLDAHDHAPSGRQHPLLTVSTTAQPPGNGKSSKPPATATPEEGVGGNETTEPPVPPPPSPSRKALVKELRRDLEHARSLRHSNPAAALAEYRAVLLRVGVELPHGDDYRRRRGTVVARPPKKLPRKSAQLHLLASAIEEAAEIFTSLQQHASALATQQTAHRLRKRALTQGPPPRPEQQATAAGELAMSSAALASAYGKEFRFEEALQTLREAEPLHRALPQPAVSVLIKLESTLHECAGDFVSALQRYETAERLSGGGGGSAPGAGQAIDWEGKLRHLELLKRVLQSERSSGMPHEVTLAMARAAAEELGFLLEHGPWDVSAQLPRNYRPQLLSQPWHKLPTLLLSGPTNGADGGGADGDSEKETATTGGSGSEEGNTSIIGSAEKASSSSSLSSATWRDDAAAVDTALARAARYLQRPEIVSRLKQEYATLKSGGHMLREQECIHEHRPSAAGSKSHGDDGVAEWRRFDITEPKYYSTPDFSSAEDGISGSMVDASGLDSSGCASSLVPVACEVLRKLRGQGNDADGEQVVEGLELPVIRAGYSAIGALTFSILL